VGQDQEMNTTKHMLQSKLSNKINDFSKCHTASSTVQTAMLFGAVAMALSVLVAPQLKNAADTYAENRALGLDRVITGSINKSKQYTIRKSVLDK
jgi:hypothetical protein